MTATQPSVDGETLELRRRIHDQLRVRPGAAANIKGRATLWTGSDEFGELSKHEVDENPRAASAKLRAGIRI